MNPVRLGITVLLLSMLAGCAHPIVITPELRAIDRSQVVPIGKKVGYYISAADRETPVTTPGGGGDKVTYYPYKELEPALQKVLFNVFQEVERVESATDSGYLTQRGIAYVFVPTIKTDSSSSGVLTWMPTKFTVMLNCKALDETGKEIWSKEFSGTGDAVFSEAAGDFSIAAKRASQKAFSDFQAELNKAGEFRRDAG